MSKHPSQRVAVFVDVQNLYYSAKNTYNSKVDFGQVLKTAVGNRHLLRAFAYVIRADVEAEKDFFSALEKQGYEVRAKDLQVFYSGAKKGDWDVGLCMDVVRVLPMVDVVVLVSGDGDYVDLLEYVRAHGRRIEVISCGETTSARLQELADDHTDIGSDRNKFLISGRNKRSSRSEKAP